MRRYSVVPSCSVFFGGYMGSMGSQMVDQFSAAILPIVVAGLTALIPILFKVAMALISLGAIVFAFYSVVTLVCPELQGIFTGTIGGMWSNYKADRLERLGRSSVGRGYATYKERSGVHDGASYPIESYSLGPHEDSEGSFSGYDYNESFGNVEFHEED